MVCVEKYGTRIRIRKKILCIRIQIKQCPDQAQDTTFMRKLRARNTNYRIRNFYRIQICVLIRNSRVPDPGPLPKMDVINKNHKNGVIS
jgi:hypothetical protein